MGCQQCGRRPGDLYCLNADGCPNDPQYEPRQDWACEPAPTGKDLKHYYCYENPCKECAADGVTGNAEKEADTRRTQQWDVSKHGTGPFSDEADW